MNIPLTRDSLVSLCAGSFDSAELAAWVAAETRVEVAIIMMAGQRFNFKGDGLKGELLSKTINSLLGGVFGAGMATGQSGYDSRSAPGWRKGVLEFITVLLEQADYDAYFGSASHVVVDAAYTLYASGVEKCMVV